jgi:hypothetical protein
VKSLQTDHAMALAKAILDIIAPCLRDEEKRDAFNMFVETAKASFEHYEMMADRRTRRIGPSNN